MRSFVVVALVAIVPVAGVLYVASRPREVPIAGGTADRIPVLHYKVKGMHCDGCVAAIQSKVAAVEGVGTCLVDLENGRADVQLNEGVDLATVKPLVEAAITRLGYTIEPATKSVGPEPPPYRPG
jgi:copper chaperone CopZ